MEPGEANAKAVEDDVSPVSGFDPDSTEIGTVSDEQVTLEPL